MAAIGAILTIVIIGIIYWVFTNFDSKQADKATDRHVKKTLADVELEKLKTQQEELRLKKEFFEYQKQQMLEDKKNPPKPEQPKSTVSSYKIKDNELEDKRKKPQS